MSRYRYDRAAVARAWKGRGPANWDATPSEDPGVSDADVAPVIPLMPPPRYPRFAEGRLDIPPLPGWLGEDGPVSRAAAFDMAPAADLEERDAAGLWSDLVGALESVGKERPWFAEGAIEGSPIIMFAGPEKSHKSWAAMQLAVATILGGKWLGKFQIKRPGSVAYFDAEYGAYEFARRVARIARGMGAEPRTVLAQIRHFYSSGMLLNLSDQELQEHGRDIAAQRPALIIVDPLRNHLDGDENSAEAINAAYRALDRLRITGNCPVHVLHHLNKSGGFSGSRAIVTRADLIVEGSDSKTAPQYITRGRTVRANDAIVASFSIRVQHEHDHDDTIASTIVSCGGIELDWDAVPSESPDDELRQKIIAEQRKVRHASRNKLAAAVGGNRQTTLKIIGELEEEGAIAFPN